MDNAELKDLLESLEQYIEKYDTTKGFISKNALDEFNPLWSVLMDYSADYTENHNSKYGLALAAYSTAVYKNAVGPDEISELSQYIHQFDKTDSVKYQYGIKKYLFYYLGLCWSRLEVLYNRKAIDSFKMYILYMLKQSYHTYYGQIKAYSFRKCSSYLYKSLINDELNMSSPNEFNDPFDCPIRMLLNKKDDIDLLIRQAYDECLKVVCFSSIEKLPYSKSRLEEPIREKKHANDVDEYKNVLMWAHYADSHKGICIKYGFPINMTKLGDDDPFVCALFKDINYSNDALEKILKEETITLDNAIFLKGSEWEYENEMRYLYCDLQNNNHFESVKIPNSIEAIYFGLKCDQSDRDTIMNIMKNKMFKDKDGNEHNIKFFQMVEDEKHFGKIKEEPIL